MILEKLRRRWLGLLCILFGSISLQSQNVGHWQIGNPYVSRCDAAVLFSLDYATLISGRQIQFEPLVTNGLQTIDNELPPDLFPMALRNRPVSAALDVNASTFYLFKGNAFLPIDKSSLQPAGNVSNWTGWPGYWKNDIDAALLWSDGSYVFIKGLQYVSFNPSTNSQSRPAQMNQWPGWPSTWTMGIDAAFNGQDGFLYFIRKGEILALDALTMQAAFGYPKKMSGAQTGVSLAGTQQADMGQSYQTLPTRTDNVSSNPNGEWCAVGTPDPSTSPEGGNIYPVKTEMAGAPDGEEFSDKLVRGTRVKEVRVWAMNMVQAIEIVTESPEGFVTEGGPKGFAMGSPKVFSFAPGECLIGIEGTWGGANGDYIYTLRFVTNKRKSPVFGGLGGRTGDNEFLFEVPPEGSFSGFHGRSSERYLHALGIKYNIYQYVAWGADGQLIETTGDKSAWNAGLEVGEAIDPSDLDPWFDDHEDVNLTEKLDTRFLFTIMPGIEAIGRSVDLTKIDPWDLSKEDGRANQSPLYITGSAKNVGSGNQKWFFPHGYNRNRSGQLSTGRSREEIKIMQSYKEYQEEFGLQVGAEFQVSGAAAGSANAAFKKRRTTSIGKTKVLISKTYDILSHSCYVDLDWKDPKTGQKNRQYLTNQFREMVDSLPVPSGKVPEIAITDMQYNGTLPPNVERFRKEYQAVIDEFGTHFINNVQFGGYYTMMSELEKNEISESKMTEMEARVSFSAGADASPGGIQSSGGVTVINNIDAGNSLGDLPGATTVGGSVGVNSSSGSTETSMNSTMNVEIFATGGSGKITYAAWEQDVKGDPIVRNAEFYPISDLMTPIFFPFDEDIERKAAALKLVIKQHVRNSAELLTHSAIDKVQFVTGADKEKYQTEMQKAEQNKPVTMEINFMKLRCNMGDPGDDWLELYGNLQWAIMDEQLNVVKKGYIFNNPSDNRTFKLKKDNSWQDLNKNIEYTTTVGKKDQLQLVFWGDITEYDDTVFDEDDDVLKISSMADGTPDGLPRTDAKGKYTSPKDANILGEEGTQLSVKYRIQWKL